MTNSQKIIGRIHQQVVFDVRVQVIDRVKFQVTDQIGDSVGNQVFGHILDQWNKTVTQKNLVGIQLNNMVRSNNL